MSQIQNLGLFLFWSGLTFSCCVSLSGMASKNTPRSRGLTSPESQRGSSRGKKGGRGRGGAAVGASLKGSITQYTVPSGLAPPSPSSLRNDIDIENDESTTPDLVGVFPKSPPGFFNGEHPRPIEPSASVFDCASPLQDDSNAATPVSPSVLFPFLLILLIFSETHFFVLSCF